LKIKTLQRREVFFYGWSANLLKTALFRDFQCWLKN
jgi:hypothetical protein